MISPAMTIRRPHPDSPDPDQRLARARLRLRVGLSHGPGAAQLRWLRDALVERRRIATLARHRGRWPLWESLEIDLHALCNRDCVFCPRHGDRSGVRKLADGTPVTTAMPTQRVRAILDEAAALGYRGPVRLHRLSEPFLDDRYVDIARQVKARGMLLFEETNGDPLRHDDTLVEQLDGLLDGLCVGLYDYRDEAHKIDQMLYWRRRFHRTPVTFSLPLEDCALRAGSAPLDDDRFPRDPRALATPCFQPATKLLIRYDGQLSLCCEDDRCAHDLGNAFEQSLAALWWSPRRVELARQLARRNGRQAIPICSRCYADQRVRLLDR